MTLQIHSLTLSISMVIALVTGLAALDKKGTPKTICLLVLSCAILLEGIAYLLHDAGMVSLRVLTSVHYLFTSIAASTHLLFAFHYTNRTHWIDLRAVASLAIQPLLIQAVYWVDSTHRLLFRPPNQAGDLINTVYALILLLSGAILLVETRRRVPRELTLRWYLAIAAALLPLVVSLTVGLAEDLNLKIALTTLSYALFLSGTGFGVINTHQVESIFITRDAVVEGMDDGWMVVDNHNLIVDLNRAAEKMVGRPREQLYGQPVTSALPYLADTFKSPEDVKEVDIRRSVKTQNEWRYINIRVSKLKDSRDLSLGYLIVWRDITKRKLAEDARQYARDELFVLLSAISSAASQSMNLEEFLAESINQIIYSFRSQAVGIYLLDEKNPAATHSRLRLKSYFGILPQQVKGVSSEALTASLMNWLRRGEEDGRPAMLDLHGEDLRPYAVLHEMGFSRIALIPLFVVTQKQSEVLGCMCLARSDDLAYTQDEMIRLKAISNQIATLIDSDRRREYAIAVSERQRLMRDLHDSVSQKLYGLVALTEAAQAGMEAGSQIAPLEVLARIGDNARQAVREMRLFLYEMQPVDLDEGLITVLHHRLAAVEGRADIKARLLVDENIVLTKDREIALYFITQEALNNILRHAHATSVAISLKRSRRNVILEIKDDGRGFDPRKVDEGGLGLRNMRDRTLNMDGRFTIASRPGRGTKITIIIPMSDEERSDS